jgi:pimeloyl-ACP methyl ester carboxylesterase
MSHKIHINDVNFNYDLFGKGPSTIVFISSYTGDINQWRPVAEALQDQHQILLFDNQGIGQTTDSGTPLNASIMAKNIHGLAFALGIKKAILVGFAFGGNLAQQIAHDYPEMVTKLILLSSVVKWSSESIARIESLIQNRKQGDFEQYCRDLYDWAFGSEFKAKVSYEELKPLLMSIIEAQNLTDQKRQAAALKQFDSTHWIRKIKAPIIVLAPKDEQFALYSDGVELASMTGATLIPLNCGHAVWAEIPEQLIELCKEHCR